MTYQRKTRDVWRIFVNYGFGDGWEHECTELSRADAKENVRLYRESCNYPVKWKKAREKIGAET